jgi:hypothetical protein
MNLIQLVSSIFKPAVELVDELHTSEHERLQEKARILDAQVVAIDAVLQYESEALKARADIVKAEATSEHILAAIWRPITMLCFCGLAVGDALGVLPNPLAEEAWTLLQIGIGGYVVARSGEKIAKGVIQAKATGT